MEANGEFVRNAWYVAGWSVDFGDELTTREICNQSLVMYRTSAGKLIALEDLCPHRFLPLSKGRRIDDAIQCGYHGMTFDGDGKCIRVPGQEMLPPNVCVRAFPVEEKHGVVWVWMGDPLKSDPSKIFDMPEFSDSNWHMHHGKALHIESGYLNVSENLVDPAHVSFVHPTTLGNAASEDVPVEFSASDDIVTSWRWIRNGPPVGFFQKFGGFKGNVDRWHYYYLHVPSTAVIDFGSIDSSLNCPEEERDKGVRIFALHFVTPQSRYKTVDYWMHLRNFEQGNDEVSEQMDQMFSIAFAEDKEILEAVQTGELQAGERRPVRIAIDKGPQTYRKRISELVAAEKSN